MSKTKHIFCLLKNSEIKQSACSFNASKLECLQCSNKPKQPASAGDLNEIFSQIIMQFSQNPEAIKAICNLPDQEAAERKIADMDCDSVPDDVFLDIVKNDSKILFSKLGKSKVQKWQKLAERGIPEGKMRLQELGHKLAYTGHNRDFLPYVAVAMIRDKVFEYLKDNKYSNLTLKDKKKLIRENFGDLISPPFSPKPSELADEITALLFGIELDTAIAYRKRCKKLKSNSGKTYFELKPSTK